MSEPRAGAAPLIRKPFTELSTTELYGILQLRSAVFVVEQSCVFLDLDGIDTLPETVHAFIPQPTRAARDSHGAQSGMSLMPAAYARVLPLSFPDGPAGAPDARSIGRVVTDPEVRGTGTGLRLLGALVAVYGNAPLVMNAQSHLEGYYGRLGFVPNGPRFMEDGIEHTPLRREPGPEALSS